MSDYTIIGAIERNSAEGLVDKFLDVCEGIKVITITSAAPHDGKSTVVYALAEALYSRGKNLLVIDADLRSFTGVASKFGLKPHQFIDKEFMEYAHDAGGYKVVYPRVFGTEAERIIASEKFKRLIDTAREQFEIVLIDTPPYLMLPDAEMVAKMSDGVVLVQSDTIIRNKRKIPAVGVIINRYRGRGNRGWQRTR